MLKSEAGIDAWITAIAGEKQKLPTPFIDGASIFVRLEDPQTPSISFQPLVSPSLLKLVPAKSSAKYSYDAAKIAAAKKKASYRKLLPSTATAATEKQFEKELNVAFAQEMELHQYSF
uniref:Uncharacterized protein n=1 Tax=Globisporangium ultimum (strain ATCC 200006 / CBS 805.95 / DAOM BR144) TaxID=431595 RepID=K3WHC2_GLOUD